MPKVKCKQGKTNDKNNPEDCYCIIHLAGLKQHGSFTPFCSIQGGPRKILAFLNAIQDTRLCEPLESVNRYEDACKLLPANLANLIS